MTDQTSGLARSVQTRLVRHAKEIGVDPNLVLTRYALERFLYRLSRSPYAERFILKGALLILAWLGETLRPTRDADLLGFGDLTEGSLTQIFSSIATLAVTPDAMKYDPTSIRVRQIRPEDEYGGTRVTLIGRLGSARLRLQLDVGIGDAVKPEPEWIEYPSLLDLPRPRLRCYRPETSIAEKIHAMVVLGSRNSRMRDFFDVFMLSRHRAFDARTLAEAIEATFVRRGTPIPDVLPVALTSDFAQSREKQAQWAAYLRKNGLEAEDFPRVVEGTSRFVAPVLTALSSRRPIASTWPAGGPWSDERLADDLHPEPSRISQCLTGYASLLLLQDALGSPAGRHRVDDVVATNSPGTRLDDFRESSSPNVLKKPNSSLASGSCLLSLDDRALSIHLVEAQLRVNLDDTFLQRWRDELVHFENLVNDGARLQRQARPVRPR